MPRFYFHVQQLGEMADDPEGTELPDLETAKTYALEAAREILADAIKWNSEFAADAIVIVDEHHRSVGCVSFVEALPKNLQTKLRDE
jgi:hypothetical protein